MWLFLILVMVCTGVMGFAFPPAWIATALALLGGLLVQQSSDVKDDWQEAKGEALNTDERAGGCAVSVLLLGVLAFFAFAALLAAGGRLP